ncbi:MAG: DUF72 domain-containing protein [Phycisphaeraceae bacterium]|nr:DUF72 domain-containing protein [Phycisphaeraceae bacterium]
MRAGWFVAENQKRPSWCIGLVGFSCPEWSKSLFTVDAGIRGRSRGDTHRLSKYAAHFNAVEINTTFYGIPSIDTVRAWADATPADFRFCVKMPRDVTHGPTPQGVLAAADGPPPGHLLREETLVTARRFLQVLQPLGGKLGAVLVQFPPKFMAQRRDELAAFLDRVGRGAPLAVELRHDSWWTPETGAILHDRGVCWAATDESPRHEAERAPDASGVDRRAPRHITPTADFLYIRWLGKHDQLDDRSKEHFDPTSRLRWWAERLRTILDRNPQVRVVYGFFDNDFAGYAPATARRFMDILGLPSPKLDTRAADEPTLFG